MLFTGHLTIFAIIVFQNDSDREIARPLRKHIQVVVIQISSCGLLYFWSYTPWKIGFVASPETSLKQVFWVKMSLILHNRSKFSKTKFIG
jgi:hypothetical protein